MQVTALYRHPIKSHGREALQQTMLTEGQAMPFDRLWAIAHDQSKADGSEWAACANFSRVAKAPALMAITASLDEQTEQVTLSHPNRPTITLHPENDADALLAWVMPLVPQDRALPDRILRLQDRGFTDTPFVSISLCNTASHRAVESLQMGPVSPHRWRGNIWFDGDTAWQEFDWIGADVRLGSAILHVKERAVRCLATTANPETGERDNDILRTLNILGHQDFSVYCTVIQNGSVAVGDKLELI